MGSQKLKYQIKDVWAENLVEEMAHLRKLVEKYPYIAMDTEFPGVVARPVGNFKSTTDYQFQTLRVNVDLLKIIQLGLTFSDENGNFPPGVCTWQFNFKFNLNDDMFAQDSIELLQKSGIDFHKHSLHGIEIDYFGELLITSGFVLLDEVKWIAFHGTYDFGYLLKVLTCEALPEEEPDFHALLKLFFPCLYDIKYLMKSCKTLKGGLQEVADNLAVERIGPQHQAGSDSLLTSVSFFKLRKLFFEDQIDDTKYLNHLYGLGAPHQTKQPPTPGVVPEKISVVTIAGKEPFVPSQSPASSSNVSSSATTGAQAGGAGDGSDWRLQDAAGPWMFKQQQSQPSAQQQQQGSQGSSWPSFPESSSSYSSLMPSQQHQTHGQSRYGFNAFGGGGAGGGGGVANWWGAGNGGAGGANGLGA